MKKVLKPAEREDAVYYSDFSGKLFDFNECGSPCEITFSFNYGSKYDGSELQFNLTDDETIQILNVIKAKLSKEIKDQYKEAIDAYDHGKERPNFHNSIELLRYMIDESAGDEQSV